MPEEVHILHRVNKLKLKAAARYNISPTQCHVGHVALEGMLESPTMLNQIDGATNTSETNRSVATRSMRLADAMRRSGLKPGDAVIVMGPNHLDLAIPYYACHFNGYSMCAMDPSVCQDDLRGLFPNICPRMIFCPKNNIEGIEEALLFNSMKARIVAFDDTNNDIATFISKFNGTEINFRPALDFDTSKTTAWLMLTSGTTGTPKVAIIPFDTLLSGIISWWTPFTAKIDITMTMATIQWLSSLMFFISSSMKHFTRLQSSAPLTPQLLVGMINKYKPNVTAWTPYMLGQFLMAAGDVCDLSSFIYIAIGGSAIEKPLLDKFRTKCDAYLYLVYGMTELLVPVFDFVENTPFGSTGKPFKNYQYRLVNENNETVSNSESGELWIKGDAFFKGYLNNPEETSQILTEDGWFKTGDIFYRDERDFFFFVERKKILIRYMGYWIPPLQLEEVIKRHPDVTEACVVGIPDPKTMELPVAAIVKKHGSNVDPQTIFDVVKGALPDLKHLHGGLFFVDALPETPSGKVHRAKVQEIARTAQRILPGN